MSDTTQTTPPIRKIPEAPRRRIITVRPKPGRRCIFATLDRVERKLNRAMGRVAQ
jgi:hypothetical protein